MKCILFSIFLVFLGGSSFAQTSNETFEKTNLTDSKGLRQGFWRLCVKIHPYLEVSSLKCSYGEYADNIKIKDWLYYNEEGYLEKREYFIGNGEYDSLYIEYNYYLNNQVKSFGKVWFKTLSNPIIDPIYLTDPETGVQELRVIQTTNDFVKLGEWKYFFEDGKPATEKDIEKEEDDK